MILISLILNIIPLILTAGMMGFLGIPIKPSTILVFSVAFGISVDDTIHFLVKYRQELQANKWKIKNCVFGLGNWGEYVLHLYRFVFWVLGLYDFKLWWYGCFRRIGVCNLALCDAGQPDPFAVSLTSLEESIANERTLKEPELIFSEDEES